LDFSAFSVWLNGNGSLLVSATDAPGHHIELWDTQTGRRLWITDVGHDQGMAIALSPDGHTLVVGTLRGEVVTLDLVTGEMLAQLAQQITSRIVSAEFSPDGEVIAVSGDDGQVHLLEASSLRQIGPLPMAPGAQWTFVSFHPDGTRMSAVDERGQIVRWETRPGAWIDRACAIAGRDLTPAEWDTYLPGVEYERTCTAVS
jgi:WD40 repeat protein